MYYEDIIENVIHFHNVLRNYVAGGGNPKLPVASRMGTVMWDQDLAILAKINVNKCAFGYDKCIALRNYPLSGQLIGKYWYIDDSRIFSAWELVKQQLETWAEEQKNVEFEYLRNIPKHYEGNNVGRFCLMITEKANRVGCAALLNYEHLFGQKYKVFYLTCNYSFDIFINSTAYTYGAPVTSECDTGYNVQYPNLCHIFEYYEYRNVTLNET